MKPVSRLPPVTESRFAVIVSKDEYEGWQRDRGDHEESKFMKRITQRHSILKAHEEALHLGELFAG